MVIWAAFSFYLKPFFRLLFRCLFSILLHKIRDWCNIKALDTETARVAIAEATSSVSIV
jgi:hypothetical protein